MLTPNELRLIAVPLLALSLAACGGGGGTTLPPDPDPGETENRAPAVTISGTAAASELLEVSFDADAEDADGDDLTYSWKQVEGPAATIVGETGGRALTIVLPKVENKASLKFEITVSDGEATATASHAVEVFEGQGLLFLDENEAGDMELYRYHLASPEPLWLSQGDAAETEAPPGNVTNVAVSPDRRHVAYIRNLEDGSSRLMVAGLDGRAPRNVGGKPIHTDGISSVSNFRWAPNDSRIVFRGDLGEIDDQFELYAVRISDDGSSSKRQVISGDMTADQTVGFEVDWSPDGTRVAFTMNPPSSQDHRLFAVGIDENSSPLSAPLDATANLPGGYSASAIAWSPDGFRLAYVAEAGAASHLLHVTHVPASLNDANPPVPNMNPVFEPERVSGVFVNDVKWSPDGKFLAYRANFNDFSIVELGVRQVDPSGLFVGDAVIVSGTISNAGSGGVLDFAWAPDGRTFAFHGDLEDETLRLYVAQLDEFGGSPARTKLTYFDGDVLPGYRWLDAEHVIYRREVEDKPVALRRHNIITDALTSLEGDAASNFGTGASAFAISPDGATVGFLFDGIHTHRMELYSIASDAPDDSHREQLSPPMSDDPSLDLDSFTWSPDGQWVAVIGDPLVDEEKGLFVFRAGDAVFTPVFMDNIEPEDYFWFGPPGQGNAE
ncbi:MAG TPA: LpqB family beta-propeller domain-containing protein [Gammaproteobacteria bacterium]